MAQSAQPTGANSPPIITNSIAPLEFNARVNWIKDKKLPAVRFALSSKKIGQVPDMSKNLSLEQMAQTNVLFNHLENGQMSPELNEAAGIEAWLAIFNNPAYHFPEDIKQRARNLLQSFQGENWGSPAATAVANNSVNSDSAEDVGSPSSYTSAAPTAPAVPAARRNTTATLRLPPANHPVWGQDGIMRGIAVKEATGRYVLDRRTDHRSAKVLGDNGLAEGAWFPFRVNALRDGAHGAPQAGISGNADSGAYSIVVAGAYEKVDVDRGDTIWYSAPGSADNKDRNAIASAAGTGYLQTSLNQRSPVRVLRAANKRSAYAPSVGIRYDGLYVVVRQETSHNALGGLFARYLLERLPGQKPLEDVRRDSPTAREMADYRRIKDLW